MPNYLSDDDALLQKSSGFQRWLSGNTGRWARTASVETPCPKCGAPVICAYADMGATDFYHTFAHVCLNPDCDYCEERDQFESNMGGGGDAPPCFFCNRSVFS